MAKSKETTSSFNLEEKLTEIRAILDQMQQGTTDFDKQMGLFQRGQALIGACRTYLGEAELKIQQLIDGAYEDFEEKY